VLLLVRMIIFESQAKGRVKGNKLYFPNSKKKGIIVNRDKSVLEGMRVTYDGEKDFEFIDVFRPNDRPHITGRRLVVEGDINFKMEEDFLYHAKISDDTGVMYVGCGKHFEIWQPNELKKFMRLAREKEWDQEAAERYFR
jgi:hypothetical protein